MHYKQSIIYCVQRLVVCLANRGHDCCSSNECHSDVWNEFVNFLSCALKRRTMDVKALSHSSSVQQEWVGDKVHSAFLSSCSLGVYIDFIPFICFVGSSPGL